MKNLKKYIFIILIIIFFIFIFNYFNNPIKEKYEEGKYCGSYNLQPNPEIGCKSNSEFIWNKYIPKDGEETGWCGLNPEPKY